MTAGDADMLIEGRNGGFIDSHGYDWDATAIKKISNPISLKEAVWDPYKRFARMIGEQINKFASNKDSSLMTSASQQLDEATAVPATPAPFQQFDIAKNVSIFVAIGLALGAIGTAIASLASALFSLQWWQFPLVVV